MPRKEAKAFQWGSCGGFAMMCFEVNHSPVEGDSDQTSAHHTEKLHLEEKNSEVNSDKKSREQCVLEEQPEQNKEQPHLEEKNSEVHSEVHSEGKSREQHVSEEQSEQSLSQVHHLTLQDWLNRESQFACD